MNIQNLSVAILAYAEANLLPQIPDTFTRWLTYAGLFAKMPQFEKMINQFMPTLKELQAVDDNGNIDFEKLRPAGLAAFDKVPEIQIADWTFNKNDFEKFISFLSM